MPSRFSTMDTAHASTARRRRRAPASGAAVRFVQDLGIECHGLSHTRAAAGEGSRAAASPLPVVPRRAARSPGRRRHSSRSRSGGRSRSRDRPAFEGAAERLKESVHLFGRDSHAFVLYREHELPEPAGPASSHPATTSDATPAGLARRPFDARFNYLPDWFFVRVVHTVIRHADRDTVIRAALRPVLKQTCRCRVITWRCRCGRRQPLRPCIGQELRYRLVQPLRVPAGRYPSVGTAPR